MMTHHNKTFYVNTKMWQFVHSPVLLCVGQCVNAH